MFMIRFVISIFITIIYLGVHFTIVTIVKHLFLHTKFTASLAGKLDISISKFENTFERSSVKYSNTISILPVKY